MPPYDEFFNKYWKEIFYFCRKKLNNNWEVAKDMAEHAFIKAWERFPSFANEENAKAFTYICAKNACFNEEDRLKRRRSTDIDDPIYEQLLFEVPATYELTVIEAEVISFIWAEIKKLPIKRRAVFELLLKGYNSDETAAILHITRKTVLNQKLDAIASIRQKVKLKFDI